MAVTLIKSNDDYFKISGVQDVLYTPYNDEDGSFEYNPSTLLETNQIFYLADFSETDYSLECRDLLKKSFNTTDFNEYQAKYPKKYLVNIDKDMYYFQRITRASLKPKKYLNLIENKGRFEKSDKGDSITVFDKPDAIYDKSSDKLTFLKFDSLKSIFPTIINLYRKATTSEVQNFLNQQFIKLDSSFSADKVKTNNRKRIAAFADKYKSFSPQQQEQLNNYIHDYENNLPYENGQFTIKSDKDLKQLILGIDQRYYTTPIDKEKRIASSIIKVKQ